MPSAAVRRALTAAFRPFEPHAVPTRTSPRADRTGLAAATNQVPSGRGSLRPYAVQLEGRSMLVKRANMFPVECVARGYLAGSGWREYKSAGTVCGIALPAGLLDGSRPPA